MVESAIVRLFASEPITHMVKCIHQPKGALNHDN